VDCDRGDQDLQPTAGRAALGIAEFREPVLRQSEGIVTVDPESTLDARQTDADGILISPQHCDLLPDWCQESGP